MTEDQTPKMNGIGLKSVQGKEDTSGHEDHVKNFLAGGFGGICLVAAGQPLDTIKVRLQTMPAPVAGQLPMYAGAIDCAKKTVSREGFRGLYKGMATPIVGVAPICALGFLASSKCKSKKQEPNDDDGLFSSLNSSTKFKEGMLCGVMTSFFLAPGERIKCLLQVQAEAEPSKAKYRGPIDCARQLLKEGGIKSLSRGFGATLLRDVPSCGMYFMTYEGLMAYLQQGKSRSESSLFSVMFAGGMAGIFSWLVALPQDILKSRLQTAPAGTYPRGVRDVLPELLRTEGVTALYRGAGPVFCLAFLPIGACFLGYKDYDYLGYAVAMKFLNAL